MPVAVNRLDSKVEIEMHLHSGMIVYRQLYELQLSCRLLLQMATEQRHATHVVKIVSFVHTRTTVQEHNGLRRYARMTLFSSCSIGNQANCTIITLTSIRLCMRMWAMLTALISYSNGQ